MSVTTHTLRASQHTAQPTQASSSLRRTTLGVGLAAAVTTTAVAAAVHTAGVPLAVDGEMIPIAGFAQMTALGAVLGGLIVALLKRRSTAPRARFLQVAGVLTALSCVPSVALPPDVATKLALVAMHLIAAAIIIPVLARQLAD